MDCTIWDSSSSASKSDGSDYLESWFDPELSFGITIRRIGAGLENLGNTCYLNSVLQCLTYTEPLAAYLQSGKHQISCRITGFCALCAIQKHVSRALQSTGRILAPKDLVSNLRCISRNFRNSRQEDAHEYMISLLESMHKCCLPKGVPSESPNAYENSLVHKIFGGRLRSQVRCMQCSYCSDKYDPFLDLSLEISKTDSLYKALMHFISKEQLDGGEKNYQCQGCKQKVRAIKQLTIDKAPYVLTVHLKRFHAYDPGQKINKRVQFDPTLNLKPFVSGSYEGDLKYTLYGVLVHAGSDTRSGHYYSFVRTTSGTWYSVDDNQVFPVDQRIVLEQKAYMLFYYRDRGNVVPKKHVHIVQNKNMAVFGLRNGMLSNYGLKGPVQDNSLEKRLGVTELNVCPMNDTQLKNEASAQKQSCLVVAESKVLKKDTDLKSLMQPLVQDLLKEISVMDTCAAIKKDELVASSTKETQSKDEPSSQKENTIVVAECKTLEKETDLKLPVASLVDNNSVKGKSGINPEMEKSESLPLSPIVLPAKGSYGNSNLGNASVSSIEIKTSTPKGVGCFSKDSSISATTLLNSKPSIKSAIENAVTNVNCKKVNTVSNTGVLIVSQSRKDGADITVGKAEPIRSPIESIKGNSEVNTVSNTGVPLVSQSRKDDDDKTVGKADLTRSPIESSKGNSEVRNIHNGADNDLKSLCGDFIETSSSPIMLNQPLQVIAPDNKLHRKVKKKVLMCHRVSMHLGTTIIFGASLSMRKKKKHKLRKKQPSVNNNLTSEHLKEIDMGPSTSEKNSLIQPRKKMGKSSSKDEHNDNCNNNLYNSVNNSSMDIDQHVTVPATDKLSHKRSRSSSGLAVDQCDTREPNVLKKVNRESMQNDVMSMLTRGLEETIGAQWDGVDLPESRAPEAKTASIGYVGDEWDVEYDRGKRKKTKNSTNNFDVQYSVLRLQNSFQALASRKIQIKKAKMDRSSSGNLPLRI